jgi:hypothetical protein
VDKRYRSALYWAPRFLGIAAALFLAIFALDVFGEGYPFGELLIALFMHLIPSLVIIIVLTISWRWERLGGGLFIFLGLLYIWLFWNPGRWLAYLLISGPLFLTGGLFLLNDWIIRGQDSSKDQQQEF